MAEINPRTSFLFNLVGGCLTLFSLQLPWLTSVTGYQLSLPGGLFDVALYWILAGAIVSFLSRYGGILTLFGILAFTIEPYSSLRNVQAGEGLLLALGGAVFTLLGTKWSIPETMFRGREILGGILYSVGFLILLTFAVSIFVFAGVGTAILNRIIVQLPLLLVASFMTVAGLKMYMRPRRGASSEISSRV